MPWLSELKKRYPARIQHAVSLSNKTTMGVGGQVEAYFTSRTSEDLSFIQELKADYGMPVYILGGGSNVIVSDNGLHGLVVSSAGLRQFECGNSKDGVVECICEAGVCLHEVVSFSLKSGLAGVEFAAGIPGTIGGALVGNAGVKERAISDIISWIEIVESNGKLFRYPREVFLWKYRFSGIVPPEKLIYRCGVKLNISSHMEVKKKYKSFLKKRTRQPKGYRNAGCIFKNPPGDSAGRLLDMCNCKGLVRGDAQVSLDHANFIVNRGEATSEDIFELIRECRYRVREETGLWLKLEVNLFGVS